jgi:hypothetical protein
MPNQSIKRKLNKQEKCSGDTLMASIKKLDSGTVPDTTDSNPTLPDANLDWDKITGTPNDGGTDAEPGQKGI